MSKVTKKRVLKIEYWQSIANNRWYGRIRGGNGQNVWGTGDGYERRAGVTNAVHVLINSGLNAKINEIKDPNAGK